ncbi:3-hydroxyisobutyrate dehydrogenase-like beta-hydroxyacid dehydrogenase [Streptomyces sp. SPB162]|nr:3-hydroxyisobutyrate dehydrogenase-like beta-hydroxyacid dehydrogenase [Streptomyces sp. SPB162]
MRPRPWRWPGASAWTRGTSSRRSTAAPLDLPYLHLKSEAILGGDFAPNFTVDGALKDARLIVAAGEAHGLQLDVAAAGAERFSRAAGLGHGGEDMAATYFASFDT